MRYVVLDTETTGIQPEQGHRIVEIAAIELVNRQVTDHHLHLYLNPGRDSDPKALEVHGLTTAFLSQHPAFSDLYQSFLDFVSGATLIIHNAPFDMAFLDAELLRVPECHRLRRYCPNIIDTLVMGRRLFPGKRNSLDALCERYQIDTSARVKHGALIDVRLLAQVYLKMTRGQQGFDLSATPASMRDVSAQHTASDMSFLTTLPMMQSSAEALQEHERYLNALEEETGSLSVWRMS